jgi:hypothetical protein
LSFDVFDPQAQLEINKAHRRTTCGVKRTMARLSSSAISAMSS